MKLQQFSPKIKGKADLVFVIDATASMEPFINSLKGKIEAFLEELTKPVGQGATALDWRIRIMGYRDLNNNDAEPWVNRDAPFVSDMASARMQLASITVDGGGDEPESLMDAVLYASLKSEWRPEKLRRLVVVFTDATSHPTVHSSTMAAFNLPADDAAAVVQAIAMAPEKINTLWFGPDSPTIVALKDRAGSQFVRCDPNTANLAVILDTMVKTLTQTGS